MTTKPINRYLTICSNSLFIIVQCSFSTKAITHSFVRRNKCSIIHIFFDIDTIMALSTPTTRTPLHTRRLTLQGYQRDDGLLDIEGHLVDTKPFDVPNKDRGGFIQEGESLHEMRVRLTLDKEMLIHHAEAVAEWTPFNYCHNSTQTFPHLVGLKIGPGWNTRVKELLGGSKGCTHITEMLGQMATTAYQALYSAKRLEEHPMDSDEKPAILDSCFGLTTDGSVVAEHWPMFYRATPSHPLNDNSNALPNPDTHGAERVTSASAV